MIKRSRNSTMSRLISLLVVVAWACNVDSFSIYGNRNLAVRNVGVRLQNARQSPQKDILRNVLASKNRISSQISMVTTDRPPVLPLSAHKQLVEGKLDNGFSYVILPNQVCDDYAVTGVC